MPFIVLFEDNPDADPAIRQRLMPDHLAFLEASGQVTAAGPLSDSGGGAQGGLWIVEGATEAEVERLIEADPFRHTGLRKSWRILTWTRVFPPA